MIRLILAVIAAILAAAAGAFFALNPGTATFQFLGWRAELPFVVAAGGLILFAFLFLVLWWGIYLAWTSPDKMKAFLSRRRREQGYDALEKALIASAAGDGEAAVRQAARADALLERPALSRLLAARAAEAAGDLEGAEAHYEALLEDKRTQVVAHRGLAQLAHERGDQQTTEEHAKDAFAKAKGARWAFEALLDSQIAQGRWEAALDTLNEGERRKQLPLEQIQRRRAVIMTAAAMSLEEEQPDRARDLAEAATKAAPGFAPAATLASRLLAQGRRHKKASDVLEAAWQASPHPVLARSYKDLRKSDTPSKRLERLKALVELAPDHRESQLLKAQIALDEGESALAERILVPLLEETAPSARMCAMIARLYRLQDRDEDARRWMTRAANASVEADWTDMDEDGRPFPYTSDDWKRMVYVYGDEGRLIHPRHERYEGAAGAVPETALLEAPRPQPARGGITPGTGTAFFDAPRQPDDPGVGEARSDGPDDEGRAA